MSRSALLTLLLALMLGLGAGLYLGWVALPTQYTDTSPASLRPALKEEAVLMIATLYTQEQDVERARARLARLGLTSPAAEVAASARRALAAGAPEADLRRLGALAAAFGPLPADLEPYAP